MAEIYRVRDEMAGQPAVPVEAPEVCSARLAGTTPNAREALERFAVCSPIPFYVILIGTKAASGAPRRRWRGVWGRASPIYSP
jgi:hypothetical protein